MGAGGALNLDPGFQVRGGGGGLCVKFRRKKSASAIEHRTTSPFRFFLLLGGFLLR